MNDVARTRILESALGALDTEFPDAWALYVFGSFARGDQRPDSDLDLAVLLPPQVDFRDKLALIARLSRQVGREVDLVNLRRASLDLVHELLREGKPLRIRRDSDVLGWEAEQMTEYADFNPRRAGILARYLDEPLNTPS